MGIVITTIAVVVWSSSTTRDDGRRSGRISITTSTSITNIPTQHIGNTSVVVDVMVAVLVSDKVSRGGG